MKRLNFLMAIIFLFFCVNAFFIAKSSAESLPVNKAFKLTVKTTNNNTQNNLFNTVTSVKQLQKYIDQAKEENKPVMIDYYADWCIDNKQIKATTFKDPDVQQAFKSFMLIKVDITKNNAETSRLKKRYNVIAPPYIVFLNNEGEEIKQLNIAGAIEADKLLEQFNKIKTKDKLREETYLKLFQHKYNNYIGNKDAKIVIFKFFDYNCPDCREIVATLEKIVKTNKDVKVVFINYPKLGDISTYAAKAALTSISLNKYPEVHHALITSKGKLTTKEQVDKIIEGVGIKKATLEKAISTGGAVTDMLLENMLTGTSLNIKYVPTLIIGYTNPPNKSTIITEATPQEIQKALEEYTKDLKK